MPKGVQASSGGGRGMWNRHDLLTKHHRMPCLRKSVAGRKIELTDDQVRLLDRVSPEFRERNMETRSSGDPVAVDALSRRPSERRRPAPSAEPHRLP